MTDVSACRLDRRSRRHRVASRRRGPDRAGARGRRADAANGCAIACARRRAQAAPCGCRVGVLAMSALTLEAPATLVGAGTVLRLIGPVRCCASTCRRTHAREDVFDGGGARFADRRTGLLDLADVPQLSIHGCTIRRSAGRGVNLLRCGGRFAQNIVEDVRDAGYFSLDGLGVDIDGNKIRRCGDNGVQVWTTVAGRYEGSRVRNNEIADIHNLSGGDGAYGNGVAHLGLRLRARREQCHPPLRLYRRAQQRRP